LSHQTRRAFRRSGATAFNSLATAFNSLAKLPHRAEAHLARELVHAPDGPARGVAAQVAFEKANFETRKSHFRLKG
jgi:hypothetical protein